MDEDDDLDLPEDEEGEGTVEAASAEKPVTRRRSGRKVPMGEVDEQGFYIDPDPSFAKELSETEKAKLTTQAALHVQKQLKEKAKDEYLKAEIARLQAVAGVGKRQLGGHLDELVTFVVNLEWEGSPYVQLELPYGQKYFHGMRYTVARHVYNEIAYIMQAQRWQNDIFNGKNPFHEQRRRTVLNMSSGEITHEAVH
jgi:hypothetical protein